MIFRGRLCIFAVLIWGLVENQLLAIHVLIKLKNRCVVPHPVRVVRSREHSDHKLLVGPVKPILGDLMSSRDKIQTITVRELPRYVFAKEITCTSRGNRIPVSVAGTWLIRIRPQQVTDASLVRHFLKPV